MVIPLIYSKLTKKDPVNGLKKFCELFKRDVKSEFAFVLMEFDHVKSLRKIIAGRDQIGVRPLYYHPHQKDSDMLLFLSEIKGADNFEK